MKNQLFLGLAIITRWFKKNERPTFFDSVRWGVAEEVLNDFYEYEGQITTDIRGENNIEGDR